MANPIIAKELQAALRQAFEEATKLRHEYVTLEHLLFSLLKDKKAQQGLKACGANLTRLRKGLETHLEAMGKVGAEGEVPEPQTTMAVERVLQRAAIHVVSSEQQVIDSGAVLVQMFKEEQSHAVFLMKKEGLTQFDLKQYFSHGIEPDGSTGDDDEAPSRAGGDEDEEGEGGGQKDPLEAYTVNLNAEAAAGRIDPLVGRAREIERTVQVLCRRRKNNPVFVGDAGVGKTALVEGLALMIHQGNVPAAIKNATVYSLDMGALLAGTKFRGQFEERLKGVIKAIQAQPDAILFIDEIHTIVGAGAVQGGSMDASNLLKPALASGRLRCIGSTTFQEYKASFDRDRALARRFQMIEVNEPSVDETVLILEGLRSKYEEFHGVHYEAGGFEAAAKLSAQYVRDKLLPDKAFDVIDEAGARVRLRGGEPPRPVTVHDIEETIAKMARIPEKTVSVKDGDKLKTLQSDLRAVIYGQDAAIETIASSILLARAGLRSPDKPIGSFLFSGPTGVGKTELAKQLAKTLGVEFVRFDMSEYSERHTVSRLIGAPPGYVGFEQGGLLTDAVRKTPHSVVVLDEIEKAHPELFNILLQVMDHATLTDNNGRKSDFRNVILILTTNAGAFEMARGSIGFGQLGDSASGKVPDESQAKTAIERIFTPEFRNRLDGWVLFKGLSRETILKVVDKEIALLQGTLDEKQVHVELTDAARAWLAKKGYDPQFGARPMARLVEKTFKQKLAQEILFGALVKGGTCKADVVGDELVLSFEAAS